MGKPAQYFKMFMDYCAPYILDSERQDKTRWSDYFLRVQYDSGSNGIAPVNPIIKESGNDNYQSSFREVIDRLVDAFPVHFDFFMGQGTDSIAFLSAKKRVDFSKLEEAANSLGLRIYKNVPFQPSQEPAYS